ncbi:RAMP superfamily CRISPR-associated protein [Streptomyces sp. TS71-3]|uniref:RAMP superfamily CRISPR-associated protein n=1 Tax=Streptomyces sp. TS71-3 TaxID=2733862 RepID=UPI001B1166E3|nr:RAMP superfamily CRISPR-associated protein [Streptomyces sp. TS71-3]GHJ35475.1 hypothetical protein Sm713_10840 [Streptomyces sp. TS71-3]
MSVHVERAVVRRLRVRGWLRALSPLHVGGAGHDPNAPLPVAVDGQGRLYVPGSGLTGALRTLLSAGRAAAESNSLWGYAEPRTRHAAVSRFVVRDALICAAPSLDDNGEPAALLDPARVETRFSVGIDRVRGVAAHGFLHARAVVPRSSFLRFELDLNSGTRDHWEDDRCEIRRLLAVLTDRRLRLGAAKTRGLGRMVLVPELTDVCEQDLTSSDGLFTVLRDGGVKADSVGTADSVRKTEEGKQRRDDSPPFLDIEVAWRPLAPVMVRASASGSDVDALPLTSAVSSDMVSPVLPGSALKGVLRSHAERIERTARGLDADAAEPNAPAPELSAAFRRQLAQLSAVNALFGSAPEGGRQQDSGEEQACSGAGCLTIDDCFADAEIPADLWARLYEPEETPGAGEPLLDTLREDYGMRRADHVAIDRWTGGAADGRLFSALEPHGLHWEPLSLTVDLVRLGSRRHDGRHLRDAAEALLLLTLRDLQAGRIRLGFASNRGMGDIQVTSITLRRSDELGEAMTLDELLATDRAGELTAAWRTYLGDGSPV